MGAAERWRATGKRGWLGGNTGSGVDAVPSVVHVHFPGHSHRTRCRGAEKVARVYLDSGWPRDNYEATCSMCDRPIRKGYRPGTDPSYLDFPEAKHN